MLWSPAPCFREEGACEGIDRRRVVRGKSMGKGWHTMTCAAGPDSFTLTMGPSMSSKPSSPPPVPTRYGRISYSTFSTFSDVRSNPVSSSMTCSTSCTS